MKLVTAREMRALEKKYFELYGMPSAVLMEAAAIAVHKHCAAYLGDMPPGKQHVVIVCGKGNNGGDGFATARYLSADGVDVKIFTTASESELKGDAMANYRLAEKIGVPINFLNDSDESMTEFHNQLSHAQLVVDALFGTGLNSGLTGVYEKAIVGINDHSRHIISIDIPSGLNSDTGQHMGVCVHANKTVTLGLPKQGLYVFPGFENCGEIVTEHIGIPKILTDEAEAEAEILSAREIYDLLPPRTPRSNKSTYGKVYLFGGCLEMPGAAVLSGLAAYKAGAGLVKVCACRSVADVVHTSVPEAVTAILPDKNGRLCRGSFEEIHSELGKADVIGLGPGLGLSRDVTEFVMSLIKNAQVPMVLDADALNAISSDVSVLLDIKKLSVITPHPGEMSRLLSSTSDIKAENKILDILSEPVKTAKEFSKRFNVVTVLKDAHTVVASPDGRAYINLTGCPGMSKAGSGDVLTGIIAALIAQKKDPFTAAVIGTYIHGRAGEQASRKLSMYGVTARDIIENISFDILKDKNC